MELISKMYKEHMQVNSEKINNLKNGQKILTDFLFQRRHIDSKQVLNITNLQINKNKNHTPDRMADINKIGM